jgi:xanthine dehydrogenase accessory factor
MDDVVATVRSWLERGETAALATIVGVERKAPRPAGTAMAIAAGGEIAGSISGGCIEAAVVDAARPVMDGAPPRLVTFGITDDQAFGVGLPCGGVLHVFLERISPGAGGDADVVRALDAVVREGRAAALVIVVATEAMIAPGTKILVSEDGSSPAVGSTGEAALDATLAAAARECLARGASERREVAGLDVFIRSFSPPPVLYVIGAVYPAPEVCQAGKLLGFRVVVCDPRSPFATRERLPFADEIVREWPDVCLKRRPLGPRDAVCVLSHDVKFDVPALRVALASNVGYVGAMGSRKNHERRVAMLREEDVPEAQLERLYSPIGLEIGAKTPGEIAVSIAAEIVAWRHRGAAARKEVASKRLAP